jgi:hypothetical protein
VNLAFGMESVRLDHRKGAIVRRRSAHMMRPPTEAAKVRGLTLSTADECRDKAEGCRRQAERAVSPKDKATWLRLAET